MNSVDFVMIAGGGGRMNPKGTPEEWADEETGKHSHKYDDPALFTGTHVHQFQPTDNHTHPKSDAREQDREQ